MGCFFVLNVQRSAKRSASQAATPGLVSTAKSVLRELVRGNPSESESTSSQIIELVPFGTPLEAARQIMTQHQFSCSVDSYTNPAQMSNSSIWNHPFVKDGQRLAVTNVARLRCETNGCHVTFWVVNGETVSLAVKGKF